MRIDVTVTLQVKAESAKLAYQLIERLLPGNQVSYTLEGGERGERKVVAELVSWFYEEEQQP